MWKSYFSTASLYLYLALTAVGSSAGAATATATAAWLMGPPSSGDRALPRIRGQQHFSDLLGAAARNNLPTRELHQAMMTACKDKKNIKNMMLMTDCSPTRAPTRRPMTLRTRTPRPSSKPVGNKKPTQVPSFKPSRFPSSKPIRIPSAKPSSKPSSHPTSKPIDPCFVDNVQLENGHLYQKVPNTLLEGY